MPIRIGAGPGPFVAPTARRRRGTLTERTASIWSATPFAPRPAALDRVALGRELEVAGADRRRDHRPDVLEDVHGAVVETEVLDRPDDLALLDEPQAVTGETRELDGLRIHGADVEEVRHEKAALGPLDELVDRARAAFEDDAARERKRFELVLGGPVTVDRNGFDDSLLDPRRPARRQARGAASAEAAEAEEPASASARPAASGDPRLSREPRVEWVRTQCDDRREDLLADSVLAARFGQ